MNYQYFAHNFYYEEDSNRNFIICIDKGTFFVNFGMLDPEICRLNTIMYSLDYNECVLKSLNE